MRKGGRIVLGVAFLAALLLAAWGRGLRAEPAKEKDKDEAPTAGEFRPGEACTVYLRGDASGVSFHDRVPDLSLLIARHGTFEFEDVHSQWVVIRDGDRHYHIPRSSIMLIEHGGGKNVRPEAATPATPEGTGRPKLDLR